jgi:hypothetical protein
VAYRCSSSRLRALILLVLAGASGCARYLPTPVRPHQRAHLADRIMRVDGDQLGRAADQHVLVTREGAFGGNGTAGGGCGCN